MSKMKLMIGVATAIGLLAGCNTVEGFGKDLSEIGSVMTETSEEAQASNAKKDDYSDLCGAPGETDC